MSQASADGKLHVAVIGAGIVGVSTAIWLRRAGHRVTLIDRKGPAGRTSHGNAGVLAAASIVPVTVPGLAAKLPRLLLSPDEPVFVQWRALPRIARTLSRFLAYASPARLEPLHRALSQMLHDTYEQHVALAAGTGAERFVTPGDYVMAYRSRAEFEADAFGWSVKQRLGHRFTVIEGGAVAEYDPLLAGRFPVLVAQHDHGRVSDPGAYTRALASHFQREGGRLLIADVVDVAPSGEVTTDRETVAADRAVVTGGVWSKPLLERLGIAVPLVAERGYHIEFDDPDEVAAPFRPAMPTMVAQAKFVFTPMDGRLRAAGVAEFGGTDDGASRAPMELLRRKALSVAPELAALRQREWMGHRPSTPDSLPLIGALPGAPNVYAGVGHQHVGLSGAPRTGRWLAALISGERPNVELKSFDAARFT